MENKQKKTSYGDTTEAQLFTLPCAVLFDFEVAHCRKMKKN
jgi:hypothetical protein